MKKKMELKRFSEARRIELVAKSKIVLLSFIILSIIDFIAPISKSRIIFNRRSSSSCESLGWFAFGLPFNNNSPRSWMNRLGTITYSRLATKWIFLVTLYKKWSIDWPSGGGEIELLIFCCSKHHQSTSISLVFNTSTRRVTIQNTMTSFYKRRSIWII